MLNLERKHILPETNLPDINELLGKGEQLSQSISPGICPFLITYDVKSESEYKRLRLSEGTIMLHGQIGYRSFTKSKLAYFKIYDQIEAAGYRIDRYGICLDWSMGYPAGLRANMPRGTGLILKKKQDFIDLTHSAPVAPHFGDFVIGTPAAVENTIAALEAGSTSIGNIGQYFTFRLPKWDDDVKTTAETVKAMALCANQSTDIMIHSNLDDGFAALFCDMSCSIGAVLIEQYIIEELIGGHVSHCYGHTFSDPLTRLAFQKALYQVTTTPGSMVYGNTTIFVANEVENYANLASYLLVDIIAQRSSPTGHGLNPVPVTEAMRIPEINEIIDVHLFANRLIQRADGFQTLINMVEVERTTNVLIDAGKRFKTRVLEGLDTAGIDIKNPFELLLAIRRIGAKKLEELFGPGEFQEGQIRNRKPIVQATPIVELKKKSEKIISVLKQSHEEKFHQTKFKICVACTDVHEYGKILVEDVLKRLNYEVIDAGVSVDPDVVAKQAKEAKVDFIAISTYNGIALSYLQSLNQEISQLGLNIPIFIGGKLNQIPVDSPTSLPVDVTDELRTMGAIVCLQVEDMLEKILKTTKERNQ
ncbi:MAG: cobalamin-dependent protein [Candidatus Heimdallarchaeota archaeon]|nr:MAG: cobalamin-dependent protein [Candidatus Heimdallarchaeota archaeon]